MRVIGAIVLSASMVASSAFAVEQKPALPSGQVAGVKNAALAGSFIGIGLGFATLAIGLALTTSSNGNDGITSTTTSSTRTLP